MKIEWKEYDYAEVLDYVNCHYNMFRRTFPITDQSTIVNVSDLTSEELGSFFENGDPHRRTGCLFDGSQRSSDTPVFNCDIDPSFYCGLFVNHKLLFTSPSSVLSGSFTYCIFDNVCFNNDKFGTKTFASCILINCSGLDKSMCQFTNCVIDKKYGNTNSTYDQTIIGNPMFISKDTNDLWDKDTNPDGVGYCRISKWRGYDYDAPIQSAGICGIADWQEISPTPHSWTPSYACNENKKIILHNNQDYVDLDGIRRNYFDKTFTEITLDFSKNGLTKADMEAIKQIYENSDNEITIYPFDDDTDKYIIGRLSKNDLVYQKIIQSYFDNGTIDSELFAGIQMTIRVTDTSHWTEEI